jgi:hypothetical protein
MANELIRPIDADTARAIEEASKTAGKAVEAAPRRFFWRWLARG